tara:strand:- start:1235 stop:1420 length:186 start_codon:yes stop_codon:yes gene_type:complete
MTDSTIAAWSREDDLLFHLRQLREENERLKKEIANQDSIMTAQAMRIVDLKTHIENLEGEE